MYLQGHIRCNFCMVTFLEDFPAIAVEVSSTVQYIIIIICLIPWFSNCLLMSNLQSLLLLTLEVLYLWYNQVWVGVHRSQCWVSLPQATIPWQPQWGLFPPVSCFSRLLRGLSLVVSCSFTAVPRIIQMMIFVMGLVLITLVMFARTWYLLPQSFWYNGYSIFWGARYISRGTRPGIPGSLLLLPGAQKGSLLFPEALKRALMACLWDKAHPLKSFRSLEKFDLHYGCVHLN